MTTRKAGGRDDELFDRLFRKHYPRVMRLYQLGFRLPEDQAADLAQDAFLRFYESLQEYRGEAEWAFLEVIARNVFFNRQRAMKAARRGGLARTESIDQLLPSEEPPAPPEPDLAEREEEKRKRELLHEAIRQLPAGQQVCLRLRLNGSKYKAIAGHLRITEDAVKTRLREAKRSLRAFVGEDPGLEDDE